MVSTQPQPFLQVQWHELQRRQASAVSRWAQAAGDGQYTATALSCMSDGTIPPGETEKNKKLIEPKSGEKTSSS
jgi:hypothetical protein